MPTQTNTAIHHGPVNTRSSPTAWPRLAAAAVLAGMGTSAHAYIDPGTASIVLQAIVGGIAVAAVYFRAQTARFLSLFRRRADRKDDCSDSSPKDVDGGPGNDD